MKILVAPDYKVFETSLASLWHEQNLADNAPAEKKLWAFTLENDADEVVGGIGGYFRWGWMYVQHLIVAPEYRGKGNGKELMFKAEHLARELGLKGMHLKTLGFQAPDFYKRCGFEIAGQIDDMPPGSVYLLMAKRF